MKTKQMVIRMVDSVVSMLVGILLGFIIGGVFTKNITNDKIVKGVSFVIEDQIYLCKQVRVVEE